MSGFIITRIQTGDDDAWRSVFDRERPDAREKATATRVFRMVDDANHVFVSLELASVVDAEEAHRRVVESGVLARFEEKQGPNLLEVVTE